MGGASAPGFCFVSVISFRIPHFPVSFKGRISILLGRADEAEVTAIMKTIKIKGMSCQHCVKAVTKTLSEIEGVQDVKVDLSRGEASFEEAQPVDLETLREKIKKAGYEVG